MPLIVLLNNSLAGLHKPEPMSVDLMCNRTRFISLLVSRHFWLCVLWVLCTLPPCHYSGGAGHFYGLLYVHLFTNCLNFWCKVCSYIWNKCLGESKFCKYDLDCSKQVISCETVCLAVGIYNTQKSFFKEKISATTTSRSLYGTSHGIVFSHGCVFWYSRHVAHCFIAFLMYSFMFN